MRPATATRPAARLVAHGAVVAVAGAELPARWLTTAERAAAGRRGERGRPAHVAGRVAAKQAVAAALAAAGLPAPAPVDIEVGNDEHGRPVASVRAGGGPVEVAVSVAHGGQVAVAVAALGRGPVGVDVEPVAPRTARFEQLTLTTIEQVAGPLPGDDRDTWLTRTWAAKEAAAKATGRGLRGRPKDFVVTGRDPGALLVAGHCVQTRVEPFGGVPHVVAVAAPEPMEVTWPSS